MMSGNRIVGGFLLRIVVGIFMVLHGLVHLLYLGHGMRLFELQPGLVWPDGSWVFSRALEDETTRLLASTACAVAAIGFMAGGIAIFAGQAWWRPVVVGAAAFSTLAYILFWNGTAQKLDGQGGFAILINMAILAAVLGFRWPDFDF